MPMKPIGFPARPVIFDQEKALWLRLTGRAGAHAFSTGDFRITRVAAPAAVVWVDCHVLAPIILAVLEPCMPHNKEARGSNQIPRAVC